MIIKASQRAGGADLAKHLMRTDENDHVRLHEMRGFAADDLKGAFKETEAISRATKCRQYLFSVSFSPPESERVADDVFLAAINSAEMRLGLDGQPRAVVFHEKEGRRHAHCVWSRIDADTMTARQMSHFKTKLTGLSRELYLEHGWQMPAGLVNSKDRNPTNFTLEEWQQAKRLGSDPRWLKAVVQDCWNRSDNAASFARALDERCMGLARGDRRGAVVVDHRGAVHALSRLLNLKTKEVAARTGDLAALLGVDEAKAKVSERMAPAIRRHIEKARDTHRLKAAYITLRKQTMVAAQRKERAELTTKQDAEWLARTIERSERLPKGLKGIWHRLTGRYQEIRRTNEGEAVQDKARHAKERQALHDRQLASRAFLQREVKAMRNAQAILLKDLRHDMLEQRWNRSPLRPTFTGRALER